MTTISVYAVVSKETNDVVGCFVKHPGHPVPKNINNLSLAYVEEDKVVGKEQVFLSSNKGNMDKLEALCLEKGNEMCVIEGRDYDVDIVLLTNLFNHDYR